MNTSSKLQRFILMPPRGLTANASSTSTHLSDFMQTLKVASAGAAALRVSPGSNASIRVLDSIHEDGLKLVEMTQASRQSLHETHPGLRVMPEVFYEIARAPRPVVATKVQPDFAGRIGAGGKTRDDGTVTLNLGAAAKIERLYVYPHASFWPMLKKNFSLPVNAPIKLKAIDLGGGGRAAIHTQDSQWQ